MRRQDFPGGWYVDALPTGERCVLLKAAKQIDTHTGRRAFPAGESFGVLFLALTSIAPFRFAGQAHDTMTPAAHEWVDGLGWRSYPPPCCGTSPVIYDQAGVLHRSDCSIGSQGWRYVNDAGVLVTGDQSLVREVAPGVLLHEFTEIDGLLVGQGHEDGVRVWDGAHERLLHPGACFTIRAHRIGQNVTVAFYEVAPDGLSAHIYDLTIAELRALPIVSAAPAPIPVLQPKPEEPKPVSIPVQVAVVIRIRSKYPTPLGATHPVFLIEVAQATGAKLLRKDGGAHVTLPNGVNVSQDILMFGDQGIDILGDGEGAAIPSWSEKGTIAGEYVDVSGFSLFPAPNPGPTVPNPGTPAPTLPPEYLARLSAIEDALKAVEEAGRAQREAMATLADAVKLLNAKPAPKYSGRIGGTGRFSTAIDLVPIA